MGANVGERVEKEGSSERVCFVGPVSHVGGRRSLEEKG